MKQHLSRLYVKFDVGSHGERRRVQLANAAVSTGAVKLGDLRPRADRVRTELLGNRYEPLEVVGSGGEGRVLRALDRQHDRFVALKIRSAPTGSAREELPREARVLLSLPPHPALPLVREDFFDRDDYVVAMDWVDGHRSGGAARRNGHTRAGAVERAPLAGPGGRGAHAPALASTAGHPRRRQARQPDPHQGRPDRRRGLRARLDRRRGRAGPGPRASSRPRWPPASRPREPRHLRPRRDRVHAADRARRAGCSRRGAGLDAERRESSRPRSGSAWQPIPRAVPRRPASWSSACVPAGRPLCRPAS